jgi:hypothetical protein
MKGKRYTTEAKGSTSGTEFENMISQIALTIGNDSGVNYTLHDPFGFVEDTVMIPGRNCDFFRLVGIERLREQPGQFV